MVRIVVLAALVVGCKAKESHPTKAAQAPTGDLRHDSKFVTPGSLRTTKVETEYGVALPAGQDIAKFERLATQKAPSATISHVPLSTLFSDEQLQYITTELTPADVAGLEATPAVILLHGVGANGPKLARELAHATSELADEAHGWVVDPETFSIYTAANFHEHVPGEHLDVRQLVTVHSIIGGNKQPFLDTAGMHRYGLPDLYVREASSGQINNMTALINGAAQVLLDGGDVDGQGRIAFDFNKLGWDMDIIGKGTGKAVWNTRWTHEPDRDDEVVELVPPTGPGIEEQMKMMEACFGSRPETITTFKEDDPELEAAAKHARDDLAKLRSHFAKGIPPTERLSVKAKFTGDDDAVEWMWVDVVAFRGDVVEGTLANVPETITSLKIGQKLKVKLADVGDYLHDKPDGKSDGGYSIELAKKRGLIPADD